MNDAYGYDFLKTGCWADYKDKSHWKPFFGQIAQNIVDKFNPKTVLDAGCAMGYLVEALRERGVEAYGFDVSKYAISNAVEGAKSYCFVHSITESLPDTVPQKFDLIITIEVMELLFPEDGEKAIANLCKYSDTIIFTSTPSDIENMTHVNVQQAEYWCKEFAKNSFFKDHLQDVDFICDWAMLFRKKENFVNVIFEYEMYDRIEKIKLNKLDVECTKNVSKIKELEERSLEEKFKYKQVAEEYSSLRKDYLELNDKCERDECLIAELTQQYNEIANAQWWKVTKPIRVIFDKMKRLANRIIKRLIRVFNNNASVSKKELKKQRETKFEKEIKFSILVPLYNTPTKFLEAMIKSVKAQTYANWELCLADGSDAEHGYVEKICKHYAFADNRIKYRRLNKNLGISENTNECAKIAAGGYFALLDHDDVLHPSALFEGVKAVNEKNADFIYTDETKFKNSVNYTFGAHYKPDFAIDNLRAYNYICHFTMFKRDLLGKEDLFRPEFDGSQDHDLVLRLTEKAQNIVHIPKILYYWRAHKGSVASAISAKPCAVKSGINAVSESLKRNNLEAQVKSSAILPTLYRIKYKIIGNPLISILIPNKDHADVLYKCINSIFEKSSYKNFEIIIIENNSKESETFSYYETLKSRKNIKVLEYEAGGKFNYSAINNFGAQFAAGEHLLFLNNDISVISEDWLEEMLMYSQRKDVGAVGAKLYYPDDTIQHAGVIIGLGGVAGHSHCGFKRIAPGYMTRLHFAQECSAVTGACLMTKKSIFEEVAGFDEKLFEVAFNDVDLCMKIRKKGYKVIWTPYAELYHYESKSRGYDDTPEKKQRFKRETLNFKTRWAKELAQGDPFYNPNLTLDRSDFSLK